MTCKEVGSVDQDLFVSLSEGEKAGARGTCYTYIYIYIHDLFYLHVGGIGFFWVPISIVSSTKGNARHLRKVMSIP